MNKDVFLSILAMDSYNRGYGQSLNGLANSGGIGTATIARQSNIQSGSPEVSAGFYAIAYTVSGVDGIADGTTVISYRGTNFDFTGWLSSPTAWLTTPAFKDIANGWSLFTGFGSDRQAKLAEQFFTAVTGAGFPDGTASGPGNTILTGHSLGGALAAYVGTQGLVSTVAFDPIPYAQAVLQNVLSRAFTATVSKLGLTTTRVLEALAGEFLPTTILFGSAITIQQIAETFAHEVQSMNPDWGAVTGFRLDGEIASKIPQDQALLGSLLAGVGGPISPAVQLLGLTQIGQGLLNLILDESFRINQRPNYGTYTNNYGLGSIELHSISLLTTILFGETQWPEEQVSQPGHGTYWKSSFKYIGNKLNDDASAKQLNIPRDNAGAQMASMIAYSALDGGERPFGDTGIRALFNDADDLGRVLDSTAEANRSELFTRSLQSVGLLVAEYAGFLAAAKALAGTEGQRDGRFTDGILSLGGSAHSDTTTLLVDLRDETWSAGSLKLVQPKAERDIIDPLISMVASKSTSVDQLYSWYQGHHSTNLSGDLFNDLDRIQFSLSKDAAYTSDQKYTKLTATILSDLGTKSQLDATKGDLAIGGNGDDNISGLGGNDMLLGGKGGDTLLGGYGDDFVDGGAGADTLYGGAGNDRLDGGAGDDTISGGSGNDDIYQSAGKDLIDGGAGLNTLYLSPTASDRLVNVGTGRAGETSFLNIRKFIASDDYTIFRGAAGKPSTFVAGLGGASFYLTAGDTADGNANSRYGNTYYISSQDSGKIKILNFKKNDKIFVDGKIFTNYTIKSKISESPIYDITGTNHDILVNAVGIQTYVTGSLGGSVNSITYLSPAQLGEVGYSAGEYVYGNGTLQTLVSLIPSTDQPGSVVEFQFAANRGLGQADQGLQLVVSGYQDGYGGIKVRSDALSLAAQFGDLQAAGSYYWSGINEHDNRGHYVDSTGRYAYSNQLYSPYSPEWQRLTQGIAHSSSELLSDYNFSAARAFRSSTPVPAEVVPGAGASGPASGGAAGPVIGSAGAEVLDSQGLSSTIVGNGGGDTFIYNRGYGAVVIDEQDSSTDPVNLLAFGDGITQDAIKVSGTETGDIILDFGNSDVLLIKGALTGTDANGVTRGVQSFTFVDGTAWSLDDVVNLALSPSEDDAAIYGDVKANQIDSQGLVSRVVGNGGGDSIYYNRGYGLLIVDEHDSSGIPDNRLIFGDQIDPLAITLSATASGDLVFDLGEGDRVILSGALSGDGTTSYGVQTVSFVDGTVWSYVDLVAKASVASADNTQLFGDRSANTFDSLGSARSITGAGGGDTFIYNSGYGLITINEVDSAIAPDNALQLGTGILLTALAVSGNAAGDMILSFGGGDQITLEGGLTSGNGETRGVQRVVFADGTVLTYADLLARVGSASLSNPSIFGDRTANTLDTLGLATCATGGGGGDTFIYQRDYGAVSIDERDDGPAPANTVHFGPGIALSDLSVAGNDDGDFVLTFGNGDVLTISAALTSSGQVTNGVQKLVFADGTVVTYAELLDLVGTARVGVGSIYGDSSANVLDTGGLVSTAIGNGGGDIFAFMAGYGQVVIDEQDAGGRSGNVLVLGTGLDPADATVSGTADGDLVLAFGANDRVVIKGALKGTDESGTAWGIEQVLFHNGTVWSYDNLLAKADSASISNTNLFGDTNANVLDGAGIANFVAGNGGGDTFKFNAGYGALTIDEKDRSSNASNSLSLGQGLTPVGLSVTGNEQGDLVLDFGGGDVITIKGALLGQDSAGLTHGIQAVTFGDGTEWSLRDLLEAAQTPSATNTILYGSSDADVLDSQGLATSIVGNGGGDTIYYSRGYGSLTIYEQDSGADAANRLILGEGIAPSQVAISTNTNGDLLLSFGGSDVITIIKGLGDGVQSIEFADGTTWDKTALEGFIQAQRQIDISGSDTELDLAALPAASYPELVLNTSPADVAVTMTSDARKLVIQSSGGSLTLDHIFLSQVEANQTLRFADGTVWHINDALAQVSNWSDVGSVLLATDGAEIFDARGHFNVIDGGGGGDTIRYKRGDGELQLTEADTLANPQNQLQLGAGISLADLTVSADPDNVGALILDFGDGDVVRLAYGMHVAPDSTFGIQTILFSDGQTLGYTDLMAMADIGSASNDGTLIGDSFGNVIDTKGFAHNGFGNVIGNGGGDTFIFNSGYGMLGISETDTSASPNNTLRLGPGITAADATVTAEYTDILLTFSGSDRVRLRNALGAEPGSVEGVQTVVFDDGTVWTAADLLQKVSTAVAGTTTIYGDSSANTLDTAGIAHTVVGNGGGDTIVFNRGYGSVFIEELDHTQPATNTLRFGAGITPDDVTPVLAGVGGFVLKLSGGDEVSFTGTNTTQTQANFGAASGIQRIEFDDGTIWTYDQLLTLADAPSASHQTLHGDVNPNTLDSLGIAHVIEGGGGGDTIVYHAGYGRLDITEYENGSSVNALQLGAGITPQAITVGSYGGALILSLGGNDRITIHPGIQNFGLNEIRFADGTIWDAASIAALRNPQSTGDATHLLASSALTGAINKRISINGNAAPLSTSGLIAFDDVDPADIHQALITNVSLQTNNSYTSGHVSLDTIKSWLSLSTPVEADGRTGEVAWAFSAPGTSLDFLRQGDFADISFTIQVRDAHGNVFDKTAKVYLNGVSTVPTGTPPAVASGTTSLASLGEAPDQTSGFTSLNANGTLKVTDPVSLKSDAATIVAVTASGATSGLPSYSKMLGWFYLGSLSSSFNNGSNLGTSNWSFSAQNHDFDYLAAGQSVTLTYETEIADQFGGKVRIPVAITITGSNDEPQIASGGTTYAFLTAETGALAGPAQLQGTGSLNFSDADVADTHAVSIASVSASGAVDGIPDMATLMSLISFDPVSEQNGAALASVGWHFSAESSLFGYLADYQTVTLSYNAQVSDGHGGTLDQTINIFVTGLPSAPPEDRAPVTLVPETVISTLNVAMPVSGIQVVDPDANSFETVTLISGRGRLRVSSKGGAWLSGNNGRALTIAGTLADVNAALATLTYQQLSGDQDSILITTNDGQLSDQHSIVVVTSESDTPPVLANPISDQNAQEDSPFTFTIPANTFTDADSGDTLTLSATLANGSPLPTWLSFDPVSRQFSGTPDNGDVGNLPLRVIATDGAGATVVATFQVAVVNTNDAPSIAYGTEATANIVEQSTLTDATVTDLASGVINFDDPDLGDTHSAAITGVRTSGDVVGLPATDALLALFSIGNVTDVAGATPGSVPWTFAASDKAFDYLGVDQTVTLTYTVAVSDNVGAVVDQDVVVTVTGTNDVPVVASQSVLTGSIVEQAGTTGSAASDSATGTIHFTDPDRSDVHQASVDAVSASGATAGLPDTQTLLSWLALSAVDETNGANDASSQWTMAAPDGAFDYLATGEVVKLNYTATVSDGQGGVLNTPVSVSITGTNDAPEIVAGSVTSGATTELLGVSGSNLPNTVSGLLEFRDPDFSDTHTATVVGVAASGPSGLPGNSALLSLFSLGMLVEDSGTTPGALSWTFAAPDQTFDFLSLGEVATLTYTVALSDGQGGVTDQDVVVTVTGTNDVPVLSVPGAQFARTNTVTRIGGIVVSDPDGNLIKNVALTTTRGTVSVTTVGNAAVTGSGTKLLKITGTLSEINQTIATLTYMSTTSGGDILAVTANDGIALASVSIGVTVSGTANHVPVIDAASVMVGAFAEATGTMGSTTVDSVTGAIRFTDADAPDTHSLTVSSVTASGSTAGLPSAATLKTFLTKGAISEQTTFAAGSLPWTFSAADKTFDYLAAGESVVLNYVLTLADNKAGSVARNVVITVTGTNDAPVIAASTTTGAITEHAALTGSGTADTATGLVKFTDADKSDIHAGAITNVAVTGVTTGLPDNAAMLAWLRKGALTEAVGTTAGSLAWTFSASDSAFDYLAAAQTVTLTYTVQIMDGSGALISQNVTITVTGTDDLPVFVASDAVVTGTIAETAGITGSTSADTANGVLNFVDADLADTHILTVTSVAASGIVAGLPSNATLKAFLAKGVLTEQAGQTPGSIPWAFSAPDKTFDYLGAGQTTTLTYVVTLADNKGGTKTQNVTIAVTGTNDAPTIASTTTAARSLTERAGLSGSSLADTATGAIKFTDPDDGDVHTLTVTGVTASGSTAFVPTVSTLLNWLTFSAVAEPAGTTAGSVTWSFAAPDNAFDYLAVGETLTLTYATVVTDSSGASVNQNVVLTITGTNDKPVATTHGGLTIDNWTALTVTAADLLSGAVDPDASDRLVLSSVQGAVGGTVAIVGGNAVFTPTATKTGPASFTYTISDGHGGTSVAAVDLAVGLHQITGTSGDDSLAGRSKPAQIDGLEGNDGIIAGTAGDLITGGAGDDTLTGGVGIDTFAYHAGFGSDTINAFTASGTKHDVLQFDSNVFSDWAHLLGATTQIGSDLQITLDPTDKITLKNVTLASFVSSDAAFV